MVLAASKNIVFFTENEKTFEDISMLCMLIGFRTKQSLFSKDLFLNFQHCDVCSFMLFNSFVINCKYDKILFKIIIFLLAPILGTARTQGPDPLWTEIQIGDPTVWYHVTTDLYYQLHNHNFTL